MFALEIINALNDSDNPAKPKGLNAKLKAAPSEDAGAKANREDFYQYETGKLKKEIQDDADDASIEELETAERILDELNASEALDRREERNISHYASGRFRY